MENKPSFELSEAILQAMHYSRSLPVTTVQKKHNCFRGPYKWIVAIVGPQKQELHSISSNLSKTASDTLNASCDINLVSALALLL